MKSLFIPLLGLATLAVVAAFSPSAAAGQPPAMELLAAVKHKHCGKELAHPAHRWGGIFGRSYMCPGGRDPRAPRAPDPKPRR